jgi:trk system potassium uptake protein
MSSKLSASGADERPASVAGGALVVHRVRQFFSSAPDRIATGWTLLVRRARRMEPMRLVVAGYFSYVAIGWALLSLPVSHGAQKGSLLDHLFTATSAMSTTGLSTLSPADGYSSFGQFVILLLIQAGGLGYMTTGSFVVLALSGRLSPWRARVGSVVLTLPEGFDLRRFLRLMVVFTFAIEVAGAAALYGMVFAPRGIPDPIWASVFHSVSAFCTAGFSLFNDSLEGYRDDTWLNVIIGMLSYLGAIGFIVLHDAWHAIRHRTAHVTLTSKIILLSTLWITVVGTLLLVCDEPALRELPLGSRWLTAWFQVMSASTTVGFDTTPIGQLSASSTFLLGLVMMIGASPAGTGGGLKTTTCTALWAVMIAVMRRTEPTFLGREIPLLRIRTAVAGLSFYCITLAAGLYGLALVETAPLVEQAFECASALGTVGLSRGITSTLSPVGKFIIVALMFVGRVGPLALAMAFFRARNELPDMPRREDIAV